MVLTITRATKKNRPYFPLYWLFHTDPHNGLSQPPHIKGQSFITNKSPKQQKRGPFFIAQRRGAGFHKTLTKSTWTLSACRARAAGSVAPNGLCWWHPQLPCFYSPSLCPFAWNPHAFCHLQCQSPTPCLCSSSQVVVNLGLQFPDALSAIASAMWELAPRASHEVVLLVLNLGVTRIDPNLESLSRSSLRIGSRCFLRFVT